MLQMFYLSSSSETLQFWRAGGFWDSKLNFSQIPCCLTLCRESEHRRSEWECRSKAVLLLWCKPVCYTNRKHLRLQDAAVVEDKIGGDELEPRFLGPEGELNHSFITWVEEEIRKTKTKNREIGQLAQEPDRQNFTQREHSNCPPTCTEIHLHVISKFVALIGLIANAFIHFLHLQAKCTYGSKLDGPLLPLMTKFWGIQLYLCASLHHNWHNISIWTCHNCH